MAAFVHRFRNPSLWSPRRPHDALSGVDLAHPLGVGLSGYWPLWLGPGEAGMRNIVTGKPTAITGTSVFPTVTAAGRAMRVQGGTNRYLLTEGGAGDVLATNNNVAFSVAMLATIATTSQVRGLASIRAGSTGRNFLILTITGIPFYRTNYGTQRDATPSVGATDGVTPILIVGVSETASSHRCYLDGELRASSTLSAGTTVGQRDNVLIGQIASNNGAEMWISFMATWNRALSAGEVAELHRNPYDFLIGTG